MSTTISKKETLVSGNCCIWFGVNSLQQRLAQVISRRMGDQNPNDLARKVRDEITSAGIRKVLKGESDVRLETLVVLAKALDTTAPLLLLEAMSGEDGVEATPERVRVELQQMGEDYKDIPRQCQKDVRDLLAVLRNNHSISGRRERLIEHRDTASRRREAALSPHPTGEELLPGEIVVHDADSLAEMFGVDDSDEDNNTERERKSA
jgi:hypothetical protein